MDLHGRWRRGPSRVVRLNSGFLLDRHNHLIGSILPPPPGGDRLFACAVPIDRRELDQAASGTGLPVSDALAQPAGGDFSRTPAGLSA